jgi:sugar phosphate isomerase/epimerase
MREGFSVLPRRRFLQALAAASGGMALTARAFAAKPARAKIALGFDNFAVRAMNWKAPALIDHAAKLELDSLFISDLDAFESLEDGYLKQIRARAADRGLQIHVGTWSICPTSGAFKNKWGTAEEHLATGIRVARALGSPVIRVVLGRGADRLSPGGIDARIRDTVKVCRACRSQALDAGVKIAVENHAGDMRAVELRGLIEEAGTEYVGANMDSGNAVWTLEDPLDNLEILGPYAVTTSLRDSAIWLSDHGATVQWTAMGDGQVEWKTYFNRFAELCPGVPVHIETISGFNRELACLKPEFWKAFPDMTTRDLAPFLALARRGKPREPWSAPVGSDRKAAEQAYQLDQLARSIRYCKEIGLGQK